MPKKVKAFSAEKLLEVTKLLESGLSLDNTCKRLGISKYTFDAICRIQPELKAIYARTKELRLKPKPKKAISESELNASVSNLGYKDPLLALTEFKRKFQEEKRALTLKSLKDPYY